MHAFFFLNMIQSLLHQLFTEGREAWTSMFSNKW